jgi:SAM-dependent methyltransferase
MHEHVHALVETASGAFELAGPVYEFGFCLAADTAGGGDLRDAFPETGYLGCELGGAARIDRLASLDRLPFPSAAARTVVCVNTLGHVFEPGKAVEEMMRILAPGGILLLCESADSGGSETIDSYWRPTPHALERLLAPLEASLVGWQGGEQSPHTVFGLGCKGPVDGGFVRGVNRLMNRLPARLEALAAQTGWTGRLRRRLFGWMESKARRRRRRDFYQVHFVVHIAAAEPLTCQLLLSSPPEQRTGTRLDLSQ